jgi:hypothetical protein
MDILRMHVRADVARGTRIRLFGLAESTQVRRNEIVAIAKARNHLLPDMGEFRPAV